MTFNTLLYEKTEAIGVITFNRPESLNAINSELMSELEQVLDEIAGDNEVRAVIVRGSEKVFMAGADVKELVAIATPSGARDFGEKARKLCKRLEDLKQPVIALVGGPAFGGGCEIALACDIRIAAENASFALPEIKLGVLPGAGGTQRLPRLVGVGRAKEMLFSGDPIDAQEAYRIGLVNKVVSVESMMDEAREMAKRFIERPGYALMTIKELVNEGMSMGLISALALEARNFEILFSTEDLKEGMTAFVEKRKPVFKNR